MIGTCLKSLGVNLYVCIRYGILTTTKVLKNVTSINHYYYTALINDHPLQLENALYGEDAPVSLMVVLQTKLSLYIQFTVSNLSGDLLMDPVCEATLRLEKMGFHVLAVTCDGASTNRQLWKLHSWAIIVKL